MSTPRRFPELMQFETEEERRAVHRAAVKKVFRGHRFWLSLVFGSVCVGGAITLIFELCSRQLLYIPSALRGGLIGGFVGGSIMALLHRLFHRAIEKEIRLEMIARGLSVCMGCGYDLRGQIEPRCPECGLAFSRNGG